MFPLSAPWLQAHRSWLKKTLRVYSYLDIPCATRKQVLSASHQGDSMDKAGMADGSFVLVRQQSTAQPGQHVVALIDDEATVKKYHVDRDVVVFESHRHQSRTPTDSF